MKLNNKGFAISTVMYIILIFALVLIVSILGLLSSRKMTLDKIKDSTLTEVKSNIFLKEYNEGDKIKVAGEYYYVISRSPRSQDYVVALKEYPLTVDEINTYGIINGINYVNKNTKSSRGVAYDITRYDPQIFEDVPTGYGGMAFYSSSKCGYRYADSDVDTDSCVNESATNYNVSHIKKVIDNWSNTKFIKGELKNVDGYNARLLSSDETPTVNSFKWDRYLEYSYWTMFTEDTSRSKVRAVKFKGFVSSSASVFRYDIAVRPVINVYKSAIAEEE